MAAEQWYYSHSARRYRHGASGRFLSDATVRDLRDRFAASGTDRARELAGKLADGSMTLPEWEQAMRAEIKAAVGAQYSAGRGGVAALTEADREAIGALTQDAYGYLGGFARDVAAGDLSEAQIGSRGALYWASTTNAYERGHAAAWGLPTLEHTPCDGSTPCRANCRCSLRISENANEYRVYWQLSAGESCSGCQDRAAAWNPLIIAKEQTS